MKEENNWLAGMITCGSKIHEKAWQLHWGARCAASERRSLHHHAAGHGVEEPPNAGGAAGHRRGQPGVHAKPNGVEEIKLGQLAADVLALAPLLAAPGGRSGRGGRAG